MIKWLPNIKKQEETKESTIVTTSSIGRILLQNFDSYCTSFESSSIPSLNETHSIGLIP
jgi:ADP-dependent phosphofructokinase/glucokinase